MHEEAVSIDSGDSWLGGMMHTPSGTPVGSVLICEPLFEERKSAHRTLVDMARALCADGFGVLRFDYRGCADSGGEFPDFSVPDWLADIQAAAGYLRQHFPQKPGGVLGLRLGATLALKAMTDPAVAPFDFSVLWEPVVNGRDYLDTELRKKLMKEMMTFGKSRCTREALMADLAAGRGIDFDGYLISPRLHQDLCALDLLQVAGGVPRQCLIVGIGASGRAPQALSQLAGALKVELMMAREQPIWSLVGLVSCPALIRETQEWMGRAARNVSQQKPVSLNPEP
jgi:exosortase A-associated hydrolase 2